MANRIRLNCFICDNETPVNTLARIDRIADDAKRVIEIKRCIAMERENIPVTEQTRICVSCNRLIVDEIHLQNDETSIIQNIILPLPSRV